MHLGQMRKSGEPYISHPIAVAEICADWKLDAQAIMAALLHDVMEDQDVKKDELIERFGAPVANLVDGLSKLEKIEFQSLIEAQAENFRKMLLAMARDVRVILIKLADRLHNMRTLGRDDARQEAPHRARDDGSVRADRAPARPEQHLPRTAGPVLLAPLSAALPTLAKAVKAARGNRREVVEQDPRIGQDHAGGQRHPGRSLWPRKNPVRHLQEDAQQAPVVLAGARRVRLPRRGRQLRQLLCRAGHAARAVQADAGQVQGLHRDSQAQRLPVAAHHPDRPVRHAGRIPDPHPGNAPHRRIGRGRALAVQERRSALSDLQQRTHAWLQSLLDIQKQTGDSAEFLEHVKVDLFPDSVYVFTPKSKIIALPRGATALDFAYSIHTDIGDQTVTVKINHEHAPLRTELRNGDIVEIVTAPNSRPSPTWLTFVRTGKARSAIRHHLRTINLHESVELGQDLLAQALMRSTCLPTCRQRWPNAC